MYYSRRPWEGANWGGLVRLGKFPSQWEHSKPGLRDLSKQTALLRSNLSFSSQSPVSRLWMVIFKLRCWSYWISHFILPQSQWGFCFDPGVNFIKNLKIVFWTPKKFGAIIWCSKCYFIVLKLKICSCVQSIKIGVKYFMKSVLDE